MFLALDPAASWLSDKALAAMLVDEQTPTPENTAEHAELWQAVATLPDPLRTTVEMYYRCDLTQGQIAAALSISQMQVSRRLTRTRELLARSARLAA